jgi:hypothetical protein
MPSIVHVLGLVATLNLLACGGAVTSEGADSAADATPSDGSDPDAQADSSELVADGGLGDNYIDPNTDFGSTTVEVIDGGSDCELETSAGDRIVLGSCCDGTACNGQCILGAAGTPTCDCFGISGGCSGGLVCCGGAARGCTLASLCGGH